MFGEFAVQEMTVAEFAKQIRNANFPVFVCGAGISYGVAPLAQDIEDGLLGAVIELAGRGSFAHIARPAIESARETKQDYLTLELLVSFIIYRIPSMREAIHELYRQLFKLSDPGSINRSIARAFETGKPSCILTSNFDDGLYSALDEIGAAYSIVTNQNVTATPLGGRQICAFHGTVFERQLDGPLSGPTTMSARELAHPFMPALSSYVKNAFDRSSMIVFLGYRGEDYYDLNVCIDEFIRAGASDIERAARRAKFFAIPHMGNKDAVSKFVHERFGSNILDLSGEGQAWLTKLCDAISGQSDTTHPAISVRRTTVAEQLLDIVHGAYPDRNAAGSAHQIAYSQICKMAKALLEDIQNGVLAVWSTSEHYRLESLGLDQGVIKSFGRPPEHRYFFGIGVKSLIDLQSDYWEFNSAFRRIINSQLPDVKALQMGQSIYRKLLATASAARNSSSSAHREIDKACCYMIEAIARDYMGLIGMRHDEWSERGLPWTAEFDSYRQADVDFEASIACAMQAGEALRKEAASFLTDTAYLSNLEKVVPWRIWRIAPQENIVRSKIFENPPRFDVLISCIKDRLAFIAEEMATFSKAPDNVDFSVAGHAAQTALRVGEAMRALCGAGESGPPNSARQLSRRMAADDMRFLLEAGRKCLDAADATSSLKNLRFMSVFDARILEAILRNNIDEALSHLLAAENYAAGNDAFNVRLDQLRSRFSS